jgi:hypothetical protein
MTASSRQPSDGWLLPLLAVVAAVAIQLPIYDRWFGLLDEGYMLALADDIGRGQMLYRDVYVDAPFPGAFYVLAGWFGLFGTSVWTARLLAIVVFAVFVGVNVRLATLLLPRLGAAAVAVLLLCYRVWAFPHWQVYSYSSLAVTLLGAAALTLAQAAPRPSLGRLLAAGVLAGAAVLSKQDFGVACTGAFGLYLVLRWVPYPEEPDRFRRSIRDAALFAAGVVLVVAPVLAAIAGQGAFPAFVYQTVVSPLASTGGDTYVGLPALAPVLHQDAGLRHNIGSYLPSILLTLRWETIAAGWAYRDTVLWDLGLKAAYYAPFVLWWAAAAWWGGRVLLRRPPTAARAEQRRWLLLAYAGGFLLAFNPPRDWVHVMMVYPPAILLACVLVHEAAARLWRPLALVLAVPAGAAVGLLVVESLSLGRQLRATFAWPIGGPRGGFYADARHGPILEDVLRSLATIPPGLPIPVYPMHPMLGFLADRPTVAGYHVIWPFQPAERDQRIIAEMERLETPAVVYSLSQYSHLAGFRQNAPRLFDYLVDHYELTTTFSRERFGPLLAALARDAHAEEPLPPQLLARLPPDGTVTAAVWPFTRALAVRVGTAASPVSASIPFDVPARAVRLDFVYGINPERWLNLVDGPFAFRIDVDGSSVFDASLDPADVLGDRRWASGAIDLRPFAGRTVQLGFGVRGPASLAGDADLAGWARFRLVSDGPAAGAS